MITARHFLLRGLLAGLIAGILAFGVAYTIGEPSVRSSIAIEESGGNPGHEHASGDAAAPEQEAGTVGTRSLQSTLGLMTATVLAGAGGGTGTYPAVYMAGIAAVTLLTTVAVRKKIAAIQFGDGATRAEQPRVSGSVAQ